MQHVTLDKPRRAVASPDLRARVKALVEREGMVGAAARLGLARGTVATIIAGLQVQPGTLTHAEAHAPQK